jgi:hypothetical protein
MQAELLGRFETMQAETEAAKTSSIAS